MNGWSPNWKPSTSFSHSDRSRDAGPLAPFTLAAWTAGGATGDSGAPNMSKRLAWPVSAAFCSI